MFELVFCVGHENTFCVLGSAYTHNMPTLHKKPQIELPEDTGSEDLEESKAKQYCFETCNSNMNKCAAEKICPDKYRVVLQ